MMPVIVKKADLNRVGVPDDYEVLDATTLGRRLGFKRYTACLPLPEELRAHTPSQPPPCYRAHLVRDERQRVGSEGRPSAWQVGAPTASLRAGERASSKPGRRIVCDHTSRCFQRVKATSTLWYSRLESSLRSRVRFRQAPPRRLP